jgi:UDP-glucose 4-epimerase
MNLLTGATGFVGGHVVEYLFAQNEISKATFRSGSHLKILDANGVQCVEADLLDHASLHEAVEGVDTIYSMASPMPGEDDDFERVNGAGVSNLLEAAREAGVKAIVHLSTLDVYGFSAKAVDAQTPVGPRGPYQVSKLSAERLMLDYARKNPGVRVVVVRAARAVGPRDLTLCAPVLRMLSRGKVVLPKGAEMSFTHPKDIAQAMYRAATAQSVAGATFLAKSFDARAADLASALAEATGARASVGTAGMLAKADLPRYTADQLGASLRLADQANWESVGYRPEFTLERTCEEVASWAKKEPWVAEQA